MMDNFSLRPPPMMGMQYRFDTGYQNHLAGVNRANIVDIPVGERLRGGERTISVGAVMTL